MGQSMPEQQATGHKACQPRLTCWHSTTTTPPFSLRLAAHSCDRMRVSWAMSREDSHHASTTAKHGGVIASMVLDGAAGCMPWPWQVQRATSTLPQQQCRWQRRRQCACWQRCTCPVHNSLPVDHSTAQHSTAQRTRVPVFIAGRPSLHIRLQHFQHHLQTWNEAHVGPDAPHLPLRVAQLAPAPPHQASARNLPAKHAALERPTPTCSISASTNANDARPKIAVRMAKICSTERRLRAC